MVGPIAGAKVTERAKIARPIGCCGLGRRVSTIVNAIGIRTPPAKPCSPRITIIEPKDDPEQAADMLRGMMVMEPQRAALLGQASPPDGSAIAGRAKACARVFLEGCRA